MSEQQQQFGTEEFVERVIEGVKDRILTSAMARESFVDVEAAHVDTLIRLVASHTFSYINELAISTHSAVLLESLYMRIGHLWSGGTFNEDGEVEQS